jgi:hypothetical protein
VCKRMSRQIEQRQGQGQGQGGHTPYAIPLTQP